METAALLDFFSGWKREAAMFRRWPEYTPSSLRVACPAFGRGIVPAKNGGQNSSAGRARITACEVGRVEPCSWFFPLSNKRYLWRPDHAGTDSPRGRVAAEGECSGADQELSSGAGGSFARETYSEEFPRVLRERRTWREFGKDPVAKETLGRLLHLSFGVQGWGRIPGGGRFALKTSPSGGGLHPLEAYILVRNVRGIARGVYHYDAVGHRLQGIRRGATSAEIQKLLAGQWWFRDAAFVVFLGAVFHRTQWKYDYPRAYRAVLAEAGHLCQTFCLTSTWLGLAPFCTMAFADTRIEALLKLDGISESVIYVMGGGTRPKEE